MGRDPYCTSLASYLHVDKGLWFPLPLQSHSCTLWSPVHYFYVYFIVVVIKFLKNKSGHSCSHVLLSYYDLTQNFDTLLWVQCSRRSFHTSDNNLQSSSICNFIQTNYHVLLKLSQSMHSCNINQLVEPYHLEVKKCVLFAIEILCFSVVLLVNIF